jgi:hypothetical protein
MEVKESNRSGRVEHMLCTPCRELLLARIKKGWIQWNVCGAETEYIMKAVREVRELIIWIQKLEKEYPDSAQKQHMAIYLTELQDLFEKITDLYLERM